MEKIDREAEERKQEREKRERDHQEAIRRLEEMIGISVATREQIRQDNDRLVGELGQVRDNLGQANGRLEAMDGQLGQANERLEVMDGQLGQANERIIGLNGQLGQVRGELGEANTQLGQANERIIGLNGQLEHVRDELGTANQNIIGLGGQLRQTRDELGQANERLAIVDENLEAARDELGEVNERLVIVEENLEEVRDVAVPKPRNGGKMHKIGLVKMSPDYEPSTRDPTYAQTSTVIVIRRQKDSFNGRIREIKRYGNGTNRNARVLFEIDNPNSINLFNRLKENNRENRMSFNGVCGIRYRHGCTDDFLLQLISEIHDVRLEL